MSHRNRKRARRGFTLVEVMMALSVMTAGAIAIFSMQNITATGARRSRIVTTATEVNRFWIERVKLQALSWGPVAYTTIPWLNLLPAGGVGTSDWFLPASEPTVDVEATAASDWFGAPMPIPSGAGVAPAPYCTSLRWTWMAVGADQVARLDVRTWWHRPPSPNSTTTTIAGCGANQVAVTAALTNIRDFGVVYSSTVVRWQGAPQ